MKLLTATITLALCACSSVSKETYTETRTLHYPKGKSPHLKDFYLQPGAEAQQQPTTNSTPDYAGVLPDSDVIPTQNTEQIAAEIERLKHENELLEARAYNQALQNLN